MPNNRKQLTASQTLTLWFIYAAPQGGRAMTTPIIPTINRLPYGYYGFESDVPECPDWCRLADREAHLDLLPDDNHSGPSFGIWFTSGANQPDGSLDLSAECDAIACLDAAGLRKVAADALAAADWLEANL